MAVGLVLLSMGPMGAKAAEDPNAKWEFNHFSSVTTDQEEFDYAAAGGHPFQSITAFGFPHARTVFVFAEAKEFLKDAEVALLHGFFGNPGVAPRCLGSGVITDSCPIDSRVGIAQVKLGNVITGIFNVKPDYGYPAQFAFKVNENPPVVLQASLRPRSEGYGLTAGSKNVTRIGPTFVGITLCGYGVEGSGESLACDAPSGFVAPFLTNPVDCAKSDPTWDIAVDSWEHPGRRLLEGFQNLSGYPDLSDPNWLQASVPATPVSGCEALVFEPGFDVRALQGPGPVHADQPTGLQVDLDFPQTNDPTDPNTNVDVSLPQTPEPKDVTVSLPAGLAISPSSANSLGACSDLTSDPAGDQVHYDSTKPVNCPESSKIGSAVATSPLLGIRDPVTDEVNAAETIPGDVYLLKPHPGDLTEGQGGKFRVLIQLEHARYGINVKLPGTAVADGETGQLTAVFTENPQLPAKNLTVDLKSGPRALLMTPVICGKLTTTTNLVPWGTPIVPDVDRSTSFDVKSAPNGVACPTSPGQRSFSPTLSAGTEFGQAGASAPFTFTLTRPDGDQELSSLDVTPPLGFTAKLAGVASCSDAALAAAKTRSGAEEQAHPSCPASSRVGTVLAGAGPGANPYYSSGDAYLAGPYKGAPLSLVFIIAAAGGSFDLGTVVVRAAVEVDPETTQITARSDPLPQILNGVPLRLRSLTTRLDRFDFARNPTDCEPKSVSVSVKGASGAGANPTTPFQVGGCKKLGFKPRLTLHVLSGFAGNRHPVIRAVLRARAGEAAISAATVTLPAGELLDLHRLPALCARKLPPELCPPASRLGQARVWSPLLAQPLEGPIYMRAPSGRFPDLVADIRGSGLHFVLHGRTSAPPRRLRIHFPAIPDIPLTKAQFTFAGGRRGVIVNSEALCGRTRRAAVSFKAHNGDLTRLQPPLRLRGRC